MASNNFVFDVRLWGIDETGSVGATVIHNGVQLAKIGGKMESPTPEAVLQAQLEIACELIQRFGQTGRLWPVAPVTAATSPVEQPATEWTVPLP